MNQLFRYIKKMETSDLVLSILVILGAVLNLFPLYWLITYLPFYSDQP